MRDLHAAGLASIAAYARVSLGRRGRALLNDGGLVACAGTSASASAYMNHGVRIDPSVPAGAALGRFAEFFGALDHGFVCTIDDGGDGDLVVALRANGARLFSDRPAPGMVVESKVDATSHSASVSPVDDPFVLDELCEVVGVAYGFGPGIRGILGGWPSDASVRGFVARDDRRVVATALAVNDDVGGIYMVGTLPEARRRGFGEAVTAAATNSLFDDGASAVVLQASAMGEPIYARMGFRTFTTYTQWAIDPPGVTGQAPAPIGEGTP